MGVSEAAEPRGAPGWIDGPINVSAKVAPDEPPPTAWVSALCSSAPDASNAPDAAATRVWSDRLGHAERQHKLADIRRPFLGRHPQRCVNAGQQ